MITSFLTGTYRWVTRFIQLQLFVTAISLPILIAWGLPSSFLSPLGNMLFGPILTAFLFLTSLLFFTELIYIPNTYIAYCLEKLTDWWLYGMQCADQRFLIGFVQPPLWFLLAIPIIACIIIQHKATASILRSSICLTLLLLLSGIYLKTISVTAELHETIPCNGGFVHIICSNKKTIIIDPGVIGKKISAASWVEYTLMPELTKLTGSTTIDHFIMLQPSQMAFEAAQTLCSKITVYSIYLPYWEGKLTKNGWRAFFNLKRCATEQKTNFIRLGRKPTAINLAKDDILTISSLPKIITHGPITYPGFCARREAKSFNLNSAKLNKK